MKPKKAEEQKRAELLRTRLNEAERFFHQAMEIQNDPIHRVLKFALPEDREITALIAAVFSYGNVKQIQATLDRVFSWLGPAPADLIARSDGHFWKKTIPRSFRHRFNNADDVGLLLTWLGHALRSSETLEHFFETGLKEVSRANADQADDIQAALESFVDRLTAFDPAPYRKPKSKGALFFLPKPSGKSACKRLLLFLRWVAGDGPMDLSIWKSFPKDKLLIPVDTHVLRISRHLGFTKRKDNSWRTAREITAALKKLDPADPTRFDFALCHLGISKECPSRFDTKICRMCRMNDLCLTYGKHVNRN